MNDISQWIQNVTGMSPEFQARLLYSLAVALLLYILRYFTVKVVKKSTDDIRSIYYWQKSTSYVATILGLLIIGRIWIRGFGSVATYLGILSAGLAVALRETISNIAGWIFILWRRPFEIGDRIQIGEFSGDVIDIRIFEFSILEIGNWVNADQSTGRVIHVPNGLVMKQTLANYSQGFQYIWNEVPVLITFESNWRKAKEILLRIAEKHALHLSRAAEQRLKEAAKKYMIYYSKLTPTVYTSVEDSGVLLTLRYLCEPRKRRDTEQAIWEDVLTEFSRCDDIDFAYPTQRFYDNILEGKPGTKPPDLRGGGFPKVRS
ncbi:MAG: mechanosensitive ion channel family protein [Candidatus Hydrothermota bacterium]|nr:MAG: mechanosensitive ion channel family protein [Candidatus Hydrothermae bacterium]